MSKQCQFKMEKPQKPVGLKGNEIGMRSELGQLGSVNIYAITPDCSRDNSSSIWNGD